MSGSPEGREFEFRVSMLEGFVMMERRGWHDVPVKTNFGGLMSGPAEAIKSVGTELNSKGGTDLMIDVRNWVADPAARQRIDELWQGIGTWTEDLREEESDDDGEDE